MSGDPVRRQALEILTGVYEGAALDPLLDQALNNLEDQRQAGFLAELVRGTLQWKGRYQHVLKQFVRRQAPQQSNELALFHLTLHQLLGLDGVPAYAAIHQAGELCRSHVSPKKVGFVNGVLQSVRRRLLPRPETPRGMREQLTRSLFADLASDPVALLAAWQSHPLWLVSRWCENYGLRVAEQICAFNNLPVGMAFHVLRPADPVVVANSLAAVGVAVDPGQRPRTLLVRERPGRTRLVDILKRHPELVVQDPTVQRATSWLIESSTLLRGTALENGAVLDMCAAPGGKTARLAVGWPGTGKIVAMDNRSGRVDLLRGTLNRLHLPRTGILAADGLSAPFPARHFSAVLLDGPCSGTGVLRHHPDGRWGLKNRTPGRNGRILRKLAHASADLLAPGGLLLYATCSLEPQENELVLDKLLAERDDLEKAPDQQGNWQRQWLPGDSGQEAGDGFFAARLRRTTRLGRNKQG